jgi:PTH1 family peptidyl-tRNA hydrolase
MIQLFVGLGNPGREYEETRHNAGFWWIDGLAQQLKIQLHMEKSYHGLIARTQVNGQTIWLLEPQTYMNVSGKSVAALAGFFKIPAGNILVVHDELDIAPGEAKLKLGGGHAGHNGLRDIHAQLGTDAYWRLRLGIGHPGHKSEVANWVLRKPMPEQNELITACVTRTLSAFEDLVSGRMVNATQKIHTSKPARAKPSKPSAPAEPM